MTNHLEQLPIAEGLSRGGSGAENAIRHESSDVSAAAESVLREQAVLPDSVQKRVDQLFENILTSVEAADSAGIKWSKTDADKQHLVELAAILYEYSNQIPELQKRLGTRVSATPIRKFLPTHPSLSDTESKVLELLLSDTTIAPEKASRMAFSLEQKKKILAAMRLLRKRDLETDSARALLERLSVGSGNLFNWVRMLGEENGVKVMTEDLVPELFARAEKELLQTQENVGAADARTADDSPPNPPVHIDLDEVPLSDDPIAEPVTNSMSPDHHGEVSNPASHKERNLEIVSQLNAQRERVIALLENSEPDSPTVRACSQLLDDIRLSTHALLGYPPDTTSPAGATSLNSTNGAVTMHEGSITLSSDVFAAVKAGDISVRVRVRERKNGQTITDIRFVERE